MSMNLLYEAYPESVNLYGVEREIVTDFKDWLRTTARSANGKNSD